MPGENSCQPLTCPGTWLFKCIGHYGNGRRVVPKMFILEGGSDKAPPRSNCNAAELVRLLKGIERAILGDNEQLKPGFYLWHLVAERL